MVDAAFGNWLAGLIDGEGSFMVERRGDNRRRACVFYRPVFWLGLRADDAAMIQEIVRRTGFGEVLARGRQENAQPQSVWRVRGRHCARLVELLDAYPLRSKKARDYRTWRQAVATWSAGGRDRQGDLLLLKGELESGRAFGLVEMESAPAEHPLPGAMTHGG